VALALSLRSGNATAGAIVSLWDQVSGFEDSPSMRALTYPPHFTFAIYDTSGVTEELAIDVMKRAAEGRPAVEITFNRIRSFEGAPLVLWADPEPKQSLFEIHHQIHTAINPEFCRPHYRPGNWIPHCTLAMRILPDRSAEALAFANGFRGSIRVVFDVVDCVAFPPVKTLAEAPLRRLGVEAPLLVVANASEASNYGAQLRT
jgi:2'-5' RNA ligase